MTYNPNEHDTVIRYSTYDLLLCEIDQDGTTQVHPNGQPRLFSYNSDGLSDVLSREMDYLNDCKSLQEDVNPIPMGQKPINRAKLIELLRQAEVALSTAIHNCDSYDMDKDLRSVDGYLCQAIEEVDEDE
jgi:hypothetical protein